MKQNARLSKHQKNEKKSPRQHHRESIRRSKGVGICNSLTPGLSPPTHVHTCTETDGLVTTAGSEKNAWALSWVSVMWAWSNVKVLHASKKKDPSKHKVLLLLSQPPETRGNWWVWFFIHDSGFIFFLTNATMMMLWVDFGGLVKKLSFWSLRNSKKAN